MGMSYNRSKFVFSETFNNANGKTSGSGFTGVVLGLIAGIGVISCIIGYFFQLPNTLELLGEMLKLVAAVTISLGIRRLSGDFNSKNLAAADATTVNTAKIADDVDATTVNTAKIAADVDATTVNTAKIAAEIAAEIDASEEKG